MKIQEFDYSVNLLQALLWQYNTAESLTSLITAKQTWYNTNQRDFWQSWYTNVFNLQTANDFGLSVWSVILDVPLQIGISPDPPGKPIWGFGPDNYPVDTNSYLNFENGSFTNGSSFFGLSTEEKRIVLRLRYYQLISRGAVPETNRALKTVFSALGAVYVLDNLDMTMDVVFTVNPGRRLLFILQTFDVIPRPAAVKLNYVIL